MKNKNIKTYSDNTIQIPNIVCKHNKLPSRNGNKEIIWYTIPFSISVNGLAKDY